MSNNKEETKKNKNEEKCKENIEDINKDVVDDFVSTNHTVMIEGEKIEYTATTGHLVIFEEEDEKGVRKKAKIFFIAYTKNGEDISKRPITFSFNGGPGSSSVWLHLGVLGPRIVYAEKEEKAEPVNPPYKLENNPYSLLDVTDLVFIDPVSTGYSRTLKNIKPQEYHNFKKDIESVGEFIRRYTSKFNRWLSPKFLIGESYGTTRASGLSGYLQENYGMYLNGIMLISAILNFQTANFTYGNDLPYILFLPTYTATAWYHKKLPEETQKKQLKDLLDEVREFALTEYNIALMKGDAIPSDEREYIIEKLHKYTGLSKEYLKWTKLRINIYKFVKELMRKEGLTVGRLDSRYTGIDRDETGDVFMYDPSYTGILGAYTATFNHYIRTELGYESELPYEILKPLYKDWDYSEFKNKFVEVTETLRSAMTQNMALKLFVGNGYYDLATPFFATEYTINHLSLHEKLRKNFTMKYYEAGHMMYLHRPSLKQLKKDLAEFIKSALK